VDGDQTDRRNGSLAATAMKQATVLRLGILAVAVGAPAAAVLLFLVEPTEGSWFPRCMLYALTGIHCPFCGATRCGHALLHGDLAQAAAYNVLTIVLLPLGVFYLYWCAWRSWRNQPVPTCNPPKWTVRAFFAFLLVFWVARNLPFHPFDLLAPHKLQ
jgi:hypothetical protein